MVSLAKRCENAALEEYVAEKLSNLPTEAPSADRVKVRRGAKSHAMGDGARAAGAGLRHGLRGPRELLPRPRHPRP
eukprot:3855754-Rhodomonas_salina.1